MPDNDFPRINSTYFSWNELALQIQGYDGGAPFRTPDFTAISFNEKLEPGIVKGQGGRKRGTTEGEYTAEGSITLTLGAHIRLMAALGDIAKQKKVKLGSVFFSVSVSWKRLVGEPLARVQLIGCRIKERSFDFSPGPDASEVETPLDINLMRLNGLSLGEIPP